MCNCVNWVNWEEIFYGHCPFLQTKLAALLIEIATVLLMMVILQTKEPVQINDTKLEGHPCSFINKIQPYHLGWGGNCCSGWPCHVVIIRIISDWRDYKFVMETLDGGPHMTFCYRIKKKKTYAVQCKCSALLMILSVDSIVYVMCLESIFTYAKFCFAYTSKHIHML